MNLRFKQGVAVAALAGTLALPTITLADSHEHEHEELTGVYHERHELMEANGKSAKAIYAMLTGEAEFDLAKVKEAAATVVESSGDTLLAMFPPGTNVAPSESLDNIWTNWDDFTVRAHDLTAKAQALGAVEDQAAVGAAFGEMGKVCGGCHDNFRIKKEE